MRRTLLIALAALGAAGCPPFQPEVAATPVPYDESSTFALSGPVTYRPDLDDGRLDTDESTLSPELRTDPEELARTPGLVAQCMTSRAASGSGPHPIVSTGAVRPGAFSITLTLTTAVPGWTRGRPVSAGASGRAQGAGASVSAQGTEATSGSAGKAAALLEIRAPDGSLVDRVRIFAQRYPEMGEPLQARADALCAGLLDRTQRYIDWRLAGDH